MLPFCYVPYFSPGDVIILDLVYHFHKIIAFCLLCISLHYMLKVAELNSQLEGKQQEVLSLQQSLNTVKQEKDTLEQELGGLVRTVT